MFSMLTAGILFGLTAGIAPGPLMMLVISQTLRHGFREGVKTGFAPLITDIPIVLLSLILLSRLRYFETVLGVITFVGGCYVFFLAWECFRAGPLFADAGQEIPRSVLKGAVTNALNPHPYLFWTTVGGPMVIEAGQKNVALSLIFIMAFYVFLVGSKVVIAAAVAKSRSFMVGRGYMIMMKTVAVLLTFFGFILCREALTLLRVMGR